MTLATTTGNEPQSTTKGIHHHRLVLERGKRSKPAPTSAAPRKGVTELVCLRRTAANQKIVRFTPTIHVPNPKRSVEIIVLTNAVDDISVLPVAYQVGAPKRSSISFSVVSGA